MTHQHNIEKQKIEHNRWVTDRGDDTHRVLYDLHEHSIVFDLGGYRGEWSEKIYNKYGCHLYIFEPIPQYCQLIVNKFNGVQSVEAICAAASNQTTDSQIHLSDDSSSMFGVGGGQLLHIHTIDIVEFIQSKNIPSIDLMKINIEGGEYDVMEHLIKNNLHTIIKNFQIQYHLNIPQYADRYHQISDCLSKTHKQTYAYQYIWENWRSDDEEV